MYIGSNIHDANKKFNKFVTILRQNSITDKCNAARILHEIHDKTSVIECELLIYALDNIINNTHKKYIKNKCILKNILFNFKNYFSFTYYPFSPSNSTPISQQTIYIILLLLLY